MAAERRHFWHWCTNVRVEVMGGTSLSGHWVHGYNNQDGRIYRLKEPPNPNTKGFNGWAAAQKKSLAAAIPEPLDEEENCLWVSDKQILVPVRTVGKSRAERYTISFGPGEENARLKSLYRCLELRRHECRVWTAEHNTVCSAEIFLLMTPGAWPWHSSAVWVSDSI